MHIIKENSQMQNGLLTDSFKLEVKLNVFWTVITTWNLGLFCILHTDR